MWCEFWCFDSNFEEYSRLLWRWLNVSRYFGGVFGPENRGLVYSAQILPLRRRNISQETSLHRTLHQMCAMEINTEKNDMTAWNVVLKSYVYICFNIWDGVLTTQHVREFMLLWQGMVTLSLNKLGQILIIMPVQCISCETRHEFLNVS